MLLAIDIGNTQTVIGLFKDNELIQSWRMITPRHETSDEIASAIYGFMHNSGYDVPDVSEIAVSCVVPRILFEIDRMTKKYFKLDPFIIDINIKTDLKINYDYPKEIGADRIANAVAAKEIYGFPAVVVDFGTATTFDILSARGEYLGGVIAPGIEISSEALFNYAAKLSKVDLSWPQFVIGKNTYDCIRSGILFGFLGQADFIVEKIIDEVKNSEEEFNPKVIATGGLAILMAGRSRYIQVHDPDLTLKGLKILVDKNRKI
ncbi:MAG: type III pantothenate kinase [Actinobacteria bacterium]|nr:type III pantothenate kinase [Actinomycetota bacterium]MBM3712893.1 type III pantothenate kinase [Actinomycetota bacterium]